MRFFLHRPRPYRGRVRRTARWCWRRSRRASRAFSFESPCFALLFPDSGSLGGGLGPGTWASVGHASSPSNEVAAMSNLGRPSIEPPSSHLPASETGGRVAAITRVWSAFHANAAKNCSQSSRNPQRVARDLLLALTSRYILADNSSAGSDVIRICSPRILRASVLNCPLS